MTFDQVKTKAKENADLQKMCDELMDMLEAAKVAPAEATSKQ